MASCKKCGGGRHVKSLIAPIVFELSGKGERTVKIGAKATILLRGLGTEDILLRSGKVLELSEADASKLLAMDAPIWKIS